MYLCKDAEGMAVAVLEELLLCIAICIIAELTGFYYLWLGAFVAYALHLFIHIIQSIVVKKYIPAVVTSIVCMTISIWIISNFVMQMSLYAYEIVMYSAIASIIIVYNLKFAHFLMNRYTEGLKFSEM